MLKERFLFILKFFHIVVNTTSFHITSQTTIQPTWAIHYESQSQNERGLQPQARLCVLMKPWSLSKENLVSMQRKILFPCLYKKETNKMGLQTLWVLQKKIWIPLHSHNVLWKKWHICRFYYVPVWSTAGWRSWTLYQQLLLLPRPMDLPER